MPKKYCLIFLGLFFLILNGCCNSCNSDEEELRTIPITNNPLIVPDSAGPLPGMPSPSKTPR